MTQSPGDIPDGVLAQLSNRVQHALRAYTPAEQKAVRTAAQTMRPNPKFKTEDVIMELGVGEALTSFLDEEGAPGVVERATILPPQSSMNTISAELRAECINESPFCGVYEQTIDRESAYEMLAASFQRQQMSFAPAAPAPQVQISTAAPAATKPQGFMVFDPATGSYVQRELPQMTAHTAPVLQVPDPVVPAPAPVQTQQMPVMVFDPTTGQYTQKMMTMQLDPTTGNYVPVPEAPAAPASPMTAREQEKLRKEQEKAAKDAAKAEKERKAEERRLRADELREERAERARKNDSVLGRVQNTAISTVTREVTRSITRGLMGGISSIFGGKKK